ncbi:MAG: hydroxyacid dehydrogenase [candidate division Zixibacteria bacterium]|nr:hydroxyacid dehydrogenase [candidate division Zixibacteria bacterium]
MILRGELRGNRQWNSILKHHTLTRMSGVRVHCVHNFRDPFRAEFEPLIDRAVSITWGPELPSPADFEILVAGRPSPEELGASPNIRALVIPWAGLPVQTQAVLKDFRDLPVHNLHHNAAPTAEMALTLMMAAAKEIIPIDQSIRRHDWTLRYNDTRALSLEGRTALILGFGAIGQRVARYCEALGMTVEIVRRHVEDAVGGEYCQHSVLDLPVLLPYANVFVITLPMTDDTRNMIGQHELALLPDNAVIVNVARGAIIDEEALYNQLASGRLRAGLDVWYNYPTDESSRSSTPPSRFPFADLPNVVMTPHLAGHSGETERLRALALAEVLNAAANGAAMPNRVDVALGY